MKPKSSVMLNFPAGGQGELVRESVRAYLHAGTCATLIARVVEGLRLYRQETLPDENLIIGLLIIRLNTLYDELNDEEKVDST